MLPGLTALSEGYRARTLDPAMVVAGCLARITEDDDAINAVVARNPSAEAEAAASAVRWAANRPRSVIDGAPILVKANIAVAGLPWHGGIEAYADRIASCDAAGVARLRTAGAVILGLTNMDEAALGASGDNPWLGRVRNPRQPGHRAGGSSGGSAAAVAAGFCAAALGTDTIGSIAIPAAWCGVVGHRAARTTIPLTNVMPLSPTLDHVGWLTRSVADATTLLDVLRADASSNAPPRLAVLNIAELDVAPPIAAIFAAMVERLRAAGAVITAVVPPVPIAGWSRILFEVAEAEAAAVHARQLVRRAEGFSPELQRMLAWGSGQGAGRRAQHLSAMMTAAAAWRARLTNCDVLLMPAVPYAAEAFDRPASGDPALFTALPALLGWASTSLPIGESDGLPVAGLAIGVSDRACLAAAGLVSAS